MQIAKFIMAPREEVFDAFINPQKLEQWCYPEGFTLKVPKFEARVGGRYQYVHSSDDGVYNCVGNVKEIIPNERLAVLDEKITDPNGNIMFQNLKGHFTFRQSDGGTEITIRQEGFRNKEEERMCEQGWVDSLNNLSNFFSARRKSPPEEGYQTQI